MSKKSHSDNKITTLSTIMDEIRRNRSEMEKAKTEIMEAVQGISKQLRRISRQSEKYEYKLKIELVEQVPYVEAYGEEKKRFRKRKREFSRLLLLAAAAYKDFNRGWLHRKKDLLDPTKGRQYISKINETFGFPVVETQRDKTRIMFKSAEIHIGGSICDFDSPWREVLEKKLAAFKRYLPEHREDFCYLEKDLRNVGNNVRTTFKLVKKAMQILGWRWQKENETKRALDQYNEVLSTLEDS